MRLRVAWAWLGSFSRGSSWTRATDRRADRERGEQARGGRVYAWPYATQLSDTRACDWGELRVIQRRT